MWPRFIRTNCLFNCYCVSNVKESSSIFVEQAKFLPCDRITHRHPTSISISTALDNSMKFRNTKNVHTNSYWFSNKLKQIRYQNQYHTSRTPHSVSYKINAVNIVFWCNRHFFAVLSLSLCQSTPPARECSITSFSITIADKCENVVIYWSAILMNVHVNQTDFGWIEERKKPAVSST